MLEIEYGNIVDDKFIKFADAIVNPCNPKMRMGSGVSGNIFLRAGVDELEEYCEKTYDVGYKDEQQKNDMKVNEIRVTPGFNLKCDIIFAQSPRLNDYKCFDDAYPLLLKTYEEILIIIKERGYKNVLIPSLGTGHYGFKHEDVCKDVSLLLKEFCEDNDVNIKLVLPTCFEAKLYIEAF